MTGQHKGTVKWFSNRKGYGFIDATIDGKDIELFCHHSSIQATEGSYRTLVEGTVIEFDVEKDEEGKLKAMNVTGEGGTPLEPPPREKKPKKASLDKAPRDKPNNRKPTKKNGNVETPKTEGPKRKDSKKKEAPFHSVLLDEVRSKVKERGIDLNMKSTVDVALEDSRIKLGQGGYAGLVKADGTIAEGGYDCDEHGLVTFKWDRCLIFEEGKWKLGDEKALIASVCLTDEMIAPVQVEETPEKLWGSEKPDPKEAFEEHGFLMRRVVLTRPPRSARRKAE